MSALAADLNRVVKGCHTYSFKIKDATQLYVGSFASLDSTGYLIPFGGAVGEKLQGRVLPTPDPAALGTQLLGETSSSPVVEATVQLDGEILPGVSVTGVTSIANLNAVVYLNANDNDLTLTRPTRGIPFGTIVRHWSSTTVDVMRFSKAQWDAIGLAGNGKTVLYLGHVDCNTIADGNIRTAIPMPFRGKFTKFYAMVDVAVETTGDSAVLNLEIGGVNVTGGLLTLTGDGTQTKGVYVEATAITAANTFSEGSTVDIEASSTVDMTAGSVDLYAEVEYLVGI